MEPAGDITHVISCVILLLSWMIVYKLQLKVKQQKNGQNDLIFPETTFFVLVYL